MYGNCFNILIVPVVIYSLLALKILDIFISYVILILLRWLFWKWVGGRGHGLD